jgi:hypothetical protein
MYRFDSKIANFCNLAGYFSTKTHEIAPLQFYLAGSFII